MPATPVGHVSLLVHLYRFACVHAAVQQRLRQRPELPDASTSHRLLAAQPHEAHT